ncbi:hypothetical protein FKM82_009176 [Ascaphus truei]
MAARRTAVPGSSALPPAVRRAAGGLADPDWFFSPWQECDKMSGAAMLRDPPAAAAAAPAAGDESSDSEGEHEGPQKLIRKVSTSGQIRSKGFLVTLGIPEPP